MPRKPEQVIRSPHFASARFRLLSIVVLVAVCAPLFAQRHGGGLNPLKVVEVKQPDGQILSFRHLAGTTEVQMRGTKLAPKASIRVKVKSLPGFVRLDMKRGDISGLEPAYKLGKDFLTYVLWSVSVDGRASNLGEITFKGDEPLNMNVTTTYQTFWLMVTAEPYYAVDEPSPTVVLYSAGQTRKETKKKRAVSVGSDLFYFTHYTTYDNGSGVASESTPSELLQARKAVDLAAQSGILAAKRGGTRLEEEYTRQALVQAKDFLGQAEQTYKKDPRNGEVIQFARTAAQTAEDARSLSLDEARDQRVRQADQLEKEVAGLHLNGAELPSEEAAPPPEDQAVTPDPQDKVEDSEPPAAPPTLATRITTRIVRVATQPAMWFALLGWGVAAVLLFRRRAI